MVLVAVVVAVQAELAEVLRKMAQYEKNRAEGKGVDGKSCSVESAGGAIAAVHHGVLCFVRFLSSFPLEFPTPRAVSRLSFTSSRVLSRSV